MKKSIAVRLGLSTLAIAVTAGVNLVIAPTTSLMASNAALGQMAHSDAAYVAAIAGMNVSTLLSGLPGWVLLAVLVLVWGSLFVKPRT